MRIDECLRQANAIDSFEAELLLAHALGVNRAWLHAHANETLSDVQVQAFEDWVQRRSEGTPIAHLTGVRSFWKHDFAIEPGCLIPRHDTETLVECALSHLQTTPKARVLDLCTGSGCIAISIQLDAPECEVTASDVSPEALNIARRNGDRLGARQITWMESDWFNAFSDERFDLIVSNPPYIRSDDPHLTQGDLRFEPQLALVGGEDGLDAYRILAEQAPRHLTQQGRLMLEHGHDQQDAVVSLLRCAGFRDIQTHRDDAHQARVIDALCPRTP